MTDNTQELDELAFRLYRLKYNQLGGGAQELLVEVLDWHNKQVEAVLDRLESQLQDPNNAEFYDENYDRLMSFDEWLLFERNKVKESK